MIALYINFLGDFTISLIKILSFFMSFQYSFCYSLDWYCPFFRKKIKKYFDSAILEISRNHGFACSAPAFYYTPFSNQWMKPIVLNIFLRILPAKLRQRAMKCRILYPGLCRLKPLTALPVFSTSQRQIFS